MVWQFVWLVIFIAATIIVISMSNNWAIFMTVLFIHEIPRGIVAPLRVNWVNEMVQDDERRATVNSYFGMLWTLAAGAGLALSGFWAQWYGIATCWQVVGGAGMVLLFLSVAVSRKKHS